MKRTVIFIYFLLTVLMSANADSGKIGLESGGSIKLFDATRLQDAINAAHDGDVIYLSDGSFGYWDSSPIVINKPVRLRGVGNTGSQLYSKVIIDIDGNPTLSSPIAEGVYFSNSVSVSKMLTGLEFKKCKISVLHFGDDMPSALIDRCWIADTLDLSNLKTNNIRIKNSKVGCLYSNYNRDCACTFINCNIANTYADNCWYVEANFVNCILDCTDVRNSEYSGHVNSSFVLNTLKTLIRDGWDYYENEYYYMEGNTNQLIYSDCSCFFSAGRLKELGYLGTDGTVIGIEGGENPYTLEVSPSITQWSFQTDETKDNVTVNISVTSKNNQK